MHARGPGHRGADHGVDRGDGLHRRRRTQAPYAPGADRCGRPRALRLEDRRPQPGDLRRRRRRLNRRPQTGGSARARTGIGSVAAPDPRRATSRSRPPPAAAPRARHAPVRVRVRAGEARCRSGRGLHRPPDLAGQGIRHRSRAHRRTRPVRRGSSRRSGRPGPRVQRHPGRTRLAALSSAASHRVEGLAQRATSRKSAASTAGPARRGAAKRLAHPLAAPRAASRRRTA